MVIVNYVIVNEGWRIDDHNITALNVVLNVSILFGEYIRWVCFSADVFNVDDSGLNVFAYGVFTELNVLETFGGHVVRPLDGGGVVVVDSDGTVSTILENI